MGRILNRAELGEFLGVSLITIDQKRRDGMPYIQEGSHGVAWQYDSEQVIEWEKDKAIQRATGNTRHSDKAELQLRRLAAETTIVEIEAAKKTGEVADLAIMEREWSNSLAEFRSRALQVPGRCGPALVGLTDERQIKDIIKDEIKEALRGLGGEEEGNATE